VRAALIDKDQKPIWHPATLAEVTDAIVDGYFAPLGPGELRFD
jgi:enoyl-CoA hydratase